MNDYLRKSEPISSGIPQKLPGLLFSARFLRPLVVGGERALVAKGGIQKCFRS